MARVESRQAGQMTLPCSGEKPIAAGDGAAMVALGRPACGTVKARLLGCTELESSIACPVLCENPATIMSYW